jgi:hypothetical protein
MFCTRIRLAMGSLAVATVVFAPAIANAQSTLVTSNSSPWDFAATFYAWGPKISGTAIGPIVGTGQNFQLNASDLLNHLNFAGMATLDVHYNDFGFFTDVLYMSLGASKSGYRKFSIDDTQIPAGLSAYVNLNLKAWIATSAFEYRLENDSQASFNLLAGARYLNIKPALGWILTGNLGPLPPQSRSGSPSATIDLTRPIVGFKGQFHIAQGWQAPVYYFDIGPNTWQAAAGFGYSFQWGQVTALYRYLDYSLGGTGLSNLTINGPMLAYTYSW